MVAAVTAPVREPQPSSPIAGLFPGYFALVMATGIISIALNLTG